MLKLNNKGVALIVAVVTTVIFLMLVMAVVVVSISTYKKSGQSHDRAIALNLAEAGINDALYQMNYRYYADPTGIYPANLQYLNPTFSPATPPMWQVPVPPLKDPFGVMAGNGYIVQFFAGGLNLDELRSTGIYNGKRRVVSINIRGANSPGALSNLSNGIAEAFNKHAVYASTVTVTGLGTTVNGNIVYTVGAAPALAGPACTITFINPTLFGVPDSTALTTGLPVPIIIYTDGSRSGGILFKDDFPGSQWDGVHTYTFAATGTTTLPAGTPLSFVTGLDFIAPTVDIDSLATINNPIKTDGSLALNNNKTIGTGVVFQPTGGITISPSIAITGDLIVAGTKITLNGGTILLPTTVTGNILCGDDITIGSVSPSTVIVKGLIYTSSTTATALTLGNTTTPDVTINGTVVASGTVTLNLCTITWDKSPFLSNTTPNVYEGFSNGRRIYLPVPRSWREE